MKKLCFAVAMAMALPGLAAASELRRVGKPVEGQYIVVLKDDQVSFAANIASRRPDVSSLAVDMASRFGLQVNMAYSHVLPGFVVRASEKQIAELLTDARVAYVEQDGYVSTSAVQTGATWGIDRVDQRNLPLSGSYEYLTTASNVHTYIVDTGVLSTHVQFSGRMGNGYTAISDGRGTEDCNGHGTHVAGTVAGTTHGIAKGAIVHPVRVLGCNGSGTNSGVIAGMDWVAANHVKPAVANMSLGGGASTATDDAVTRMHNAGVTVVVAAGNDNSNACNYSPARAPVAITVGSTTNTDARSSFSNFGTCLDIFAPGSNILSAWYTGTSATNTISGTSMASPHVAGAAALYLANNPTATPAQVATALINNSTPNKVTSAGTGSPNRLLYSIFGGTTPVDNPPTASFTFSCSGLTCSFNGSGSTDDNGISSYSWTFGDGATATGSTASRTYAAAGTYTATLTVRDTANQANSTSRTVTVSTGPTAPCTSCEAYSGTLSGSGAQAFIPGGTYYYSSVSGTHRGWLRGPASGADFDLALQRWNGSSWVTVASGTSSSSNEDVSYNGTAAYYRWRVYSYSGSGSYNFWMQRP